MVYAFTTYDDGTECSETSAHKIQTPWNNPKERIQHSSIYLIYFSTLNVIRGNGSTEHSKGNKTVPGKVATTRTEDGHKQNIKTNTTISTKRTKEHRTTEEEMEGPTSS